MKGKLNILFIETPSPWLIKAHAQIPMGALLIATIVKNAGYNVKYIRPLKKEEILTYGKYDVYAFSSTTLEYNMTEECAKLIKDTYPKAKIMLGGCHTTQLPQSIDNTLFNAICVGEGEQVVLKILEDFKHGKYHPSPYNQPNYISDLDTLPFIDYDLVEGDLGKTIFFEGKIYKKGGAVNFITSRGCPFDCAFCASQSMWTRHVRFRSIKNIIEEMKILIDKYNISEFRFGDDNATSSGKRCLDLCTAIKPLDIVWRCSIRAESITPEVAKAMYESGCREISPGIESGDQRVLDFLNKRTTLEKMIIGCSNARNAGLKIRALIMIGTPGEFPDTPELTRDYLKILPHDAMTLSTFVPIPGTDIWNDPEKFKCEILSKDFSCYNKDYFCMKNGKASKREYMPLIWNKLLTMGQQINNVKRMEFYIDEQERYNKGL